MPGLGMARSFALAGMDPAEVGDMVLEAIRNERFWIMTHPNEFMPFIEKRVTDIKRDHAHRL